MRNGSLIAVATRNSGSGVCVSDGPGDSPMSPARNIGEDASGVGLTPTTAYGRIKSGFVKVGDGGGSCEVVLCCMRMGEKLSAMG